jgi:hypothetical protein
MSDPISRFAEQLSELGFDRWSQSDMDAVLSGHDQSELKAYGALTFIQVDLFTPGLKFAFDEHCELWASNQPVDLAPLGFSEVKIDEEGAMLPPTRH